MVLIQLLLPTAQDTESPESGRAGRDGLPAECILLFHRAVTGGCSRSSWPVGIRPTQISTR